MRIGLAKEKAVGVFAGRIGLLFFSRGGGITASLSSLSCPGRKLTAAGGDPGCGRVPLGVDSLEGTIGEGGGPLGFGGGAVASESLPFTKKKA